MKINDIKAILGEVPEEKANELLGLVNKSIDAKDIESKEIQKKLKEIEAQKKAIEDEKVRVATEKENLNKRYTIVTELGIKDPMFQETLMSLADKQKVEDGEDYASVIKKVNNTLKSYYAQPTQAPVVENQAQEAIAPAQEEESEEPAPLARDVKHNSNVNVNDVADQGYASFIRKKR